MAWTAETWEKGLHNSSTSTSSSSNMSGNSSDVYDLPVRIGGCEKWITGLTKRTTCDDTIYALLHHEGNQEEAIDVSNFAIYERWRDVERPLRGRTKILKVWRAWGSERNNVVFLLRKMETIVDSCSEISKVSSHKRSHRRRHGGREREKGKSDKNFAKKAFAQHKKSVKKPNDTEDPAKSKAFHQLVHCVLDNEKRIQDQLSRIKEMDVQIEHYETKVHLLRMEQNGQNYVQDAYLQEKSDTSSLSGDELFPSIKANDLEAYLHICENIIHMEDTLQEEARKIEDLSIQIFEESYKEAPSSLSGPQVVNCPERTSNSGGHNHHSPMDIEQMKEDIQRCISLSAAQQKQLALVNETVKECDEQLQKKQDYICRLLSEEKASEIANKVENQNYPQTYYEPNYFEGHDNASGDSKLRESVRGRSQERKRPPSQDLPPPPPYRQRSVSRSRYIPRDYDTRTEQNAQQISQNRDRGYYGSSQELHRNGSVKTMVPRDQSKERAPQKNSEQYFTGSSQELQRGSSLKTIVPRDKSRERVSPRNGEHYFTESSQKLQRGGSLKTIVPHDQIRERASPKNSEQYFTESPRGQQSNGPVLPHDQNRGRAPETPMPTYRIVERPKSVPPQNLQFERPQSTYPQSDHNRPVSVHPPSPSQSSDSAGPFTETSWDSSTSPVTSTPFKEYTHAPSSQYRQRQTQGETNPQTYPAPNNYLNQIDMKKDGKINNAQLIPSQTYLHTQISPDLKSPPYTNISQGINSREQFPNTKYVDNDSNSDTGLSSLHSDEPLPILETLV